MSTSVDQPTFSVTEVDDIMEVSSDRGVDAGDDDIDIDFGLDALDEDQILEDAISTTDFDDGMLVQPSPATGNDEHMIDEDPYHMNEENLIQEPTYAMEHETFTMPFDAPQSADIDFEDGHNEDATDFADVTSSKTQFAEDPFVNVGELPSGADIHAEVDDNANIYKHIHKGNGEENHEENQEGTYEETPDESNQEVAGSATEDCQGKLKDKKEPQQADSPKDSSHVLANSSPETADHGISAALSPKSSPSRSTKIVRRDSISYNFGIVEDVAAAPDGNDHDSLSKSREVIVSYQDAEYTLFSKSELDDPDSYFLTDFSILGKPLNSFFEAIREVIHEDLADDDELCIMVEDLGLEIMESYVSSQDICFNEIIDLHAKLLLNDGDESLRSLHMYLGTRPSFRVRFAKLTKGAEEGKGFSEVAQWDVNSEIVDEFENLEEYHEGNESILEPQNRQEHEGHEGNNHDLPEDIQSQEAVESKVNGTLEPIPTGLATDDAQEITTQQANTNKGAEISQERVADGNIGSKHDIGEYDEDGDLLDYSEDEQDPPSTGKKNDASPLETDERKTHNVEYQAKNEEVRRTSISLAESGNDTDNILETSEEKAHDTKETTKDPIDENGVDYDDEENEGDNFQPGEVANEYIQALQSDLQHYEESVDLSVEYGVNDLNDNLEISEGLALLPPDPGEEPDTANGSFEDEIEFGEEAFTTGKGLLEPDEATVDIANGGRHDEHSTSKDSEVGKSGDAEIEEMESIGSAKTLESSKEPQLEQDDEIDYDDDEVREPLEPQHASPDTESLPHAGDKRVRVDDNSDDAFNTRSKDAKRPKSGDSAYAHS